VAKKKKGGERGNISVTKNDRGGSWDLKKLLSTSLLGDPTSYVEKKEGIIATKLFLCFLCWGRKNLTFPLRN